MLKPTKMAAALSILSLLGFAASPANAHPHKKHRCLITFNKTTGAITGGAVGALLGKAVIGGTGGLVVGAAAGGIGGHSLARNGPKPCKHRR